MEEEKKAKTAKAEEKKEPAKKAPAKKAEAAEEKNTEKKLLQKNVDCHYFSSFGDVEIFLLQNCIPNDLLITMGAGDVVNIGDSLLK